MDNKTDRELIELATKAYGLSGSNDKDIARYISKWNPLVDSGDAFRLMAKLGLDIVFMHGFKQIYCYRRVDQDRVQMHGIVGFGNGTCKKHTNDDVRRAIVMAAAKIGEGME